MMRDQEHRWPESPRGGSWLQDEVIEEIMQFRFTTGSDAKILFAIALTQARFGGRTGYSGLPLCSLARITGVSLSTAKRSVARLIRGGMLVRKKVGRTPIICTAFGQAEPLIAVEKVVPVIAANTAVRIKPIQPSAIHPSGDLARKNPQIICGGNFDEWK